MEYNSLTRGPTQTSWIGSMESQPLAHQGSSLTSFLTSIQISRFPRSSFPEGTFFQMKITDIFLNVFDHPPTPPPNYECLYYSRGRRKSNMFLHVQNSHLKYKLVCISRLPWWFSGKESACQCRRQKKCRFSLWVGKIPCRRKWQPTPVFLPGKSHGWKSLVGCSPWGCKRVGYNWVTKQQHMFLQTTISYPEATDW